MSIEIIVNRGILTIEILDSFCFINAKKKHFNDFNQFTLLRLNKNG